MLPLRFLGEDRPGPGGAMINWAGVQARISLGEDQTTELGRFRSFSEKNWLKTACAMANSDGGLIVLGVRDDGSLDGVPMEPEEVRERLANILQNSFNGPLHARLGRAEVDGRWIHWIEVQKMRGPEPMRVDGRVYVRRDRGSKEPSASELQELYNTFGLILTEERMLAETSIADVEFGAFRAYMARRGVDLGAPDTEPLPDEEELTRAEVLAADVDRTLRPTLYGILCFGREPQRFSFTRAFLVQLSAYAGLDRGDDVLSVADAVGRLDEQVTRAEEWLRGLGRQERYEGLLREDRFVLPQRAFREALVNAVAHRDYSLVGAKIQVDVFDDRVEVTSPGALPNHKTPESVERGGPPRSRNEAMANFLLVQRLMEQRGTGFPRVRKAMQAFNGTIPELRTSESERWVRVTFRR